MANNILDRLRGKKEEAFDEWDVIEPPKQNELKNFHGTSPDPNLQYRPGHNSLASNGGQLGGCKKRGTPQPSTSTYSGSNYFGTRDEVCPDCNTRHNTFRLGPCEFSWSGNAPTEEPPAEETPAGKKSSKGQQPVRDELYPCSSCNSYHYTTDCIYLLPWFQWLEYHSKFMPSQPYPYPTSVRQRDSLLSRRLDPSFGKIDPDTATDDDISDLRGKAQHLDSIESIHRPNYVSKTRMKADLMTKSSREMFYEDEKWQLKLEKRKLNSVENCEGWENNHRHKEENRIAWASDLAENDKYRHGFDEDEDEFFADLREDLGNKLPRTSTATIFR